MHTHDDLFFNPAVRFSRKDCITFEHVLAAAIREGVPFASYSLFFPQTPPARLWPEGERPHGVAEYIPDERKLLIPLALRGEFLGVFVARGVRLTAPKTMTRMLPRLAGQCLEKLLLYKMGSTDPLTGLAARLPFLAAMEREVDLVRNCLRPEAGDCPELALGSYRASLGLVVVKVAGLPALQRDHGHIFTDGILAELGGLAAKACPETGLAGRPSETVLGCFLPGGGTKLCMKLAESLREALSAYVPVHPVTAQRIVLSTGVGYTVFPKDAAGQVHELPAAEQSRVMLQKAVLAATAAVDRKAALGFGRLLERGGRIAERLGEEKLLIDLGRAAGAREGDRFLVQPSRAEIEVTETREGISLAEIVQPGDPASPLEPGDPLEKVARPAPQADDDAGAAGHGLPDYRDFAAGFSARRENADTFLLGLIRLEPGPAEDAQLAERAWAAIEDAMPDKSLCGRFAVNTLVTYHPSMDADAGRALYAELLARLEAEFEVSVAVGLAVHPFLSFSKADAVDNCRKALEYALLLPEPRIGVLDSLALNIHADKLFSQNDLYAAMDEYKRALLADATNAMARNSLGICLARLGRLAQARAEFVHVLSQDPEDVMALYNLGFTCQKLGEHAEAAKAFKACLEVKQDHLFSRLRLGQLAEVQGAYGEAREQYLSASTLEEGPGVADRYLARLALRQGDLDEARERLHQALRHDPQDAMSLHLMARLYLDGGEDPEVSEMLARQSVALRPGKPEFWNLLARALDQRNKSDEAAAARAKASSL